MAQAPLKKHTQREPDIKYFQNSHLLLSSSQRLNMQELSNLTNKVKKYKEIRNNTTAYREVWNTELKDKLVKLLEDTCQKVGLEATIEHRDQIKNLGAVILSLGKTHSGIYEELENNMKRQFVRANGMLVYQQLFNGKIIVMIVYPLIEGVGEPAPSKMIAIYRPEEMQPPFIIRHLEEFVKEITEWEDYDDDEKQPQKIGFQVGYDLDDLKE